MIREAVLTAAVLFAFAASGCIVSSAPPRRHAPPRHQPPAAAPPAAQPPAAQPPAAQPPAAQPPLSTPPAAPPPATTIPIPGKQPGQIPFPGTVPPAAPQCNPPLQWNGTACVHPSAGPPPVRPPWVCPNGQHLEGANCVLDHPPVPPN